MDDELTLLCNRLRQYLQLPYEVAMIGVAQGGPKPEKLFVYLQKKVKIDRIKVFEGHPVEYEYVGKIKLA